MLSDSRLRFDHNAIDLFGPEEETTLSFDRTRGSDGRLRVLGKRFALSTKCMGDPGRERVLFDGGGAVVDLGRRRGLGGREHER